MSGGPLRHLADQTRRVHLLFNNKLTGQAGHMRREIFQFSPGFPGNQQ